MRYKPLGHGVSPKFYSVLIVFLERKVKNLCFLLPAYSVKGLLGIHTSEPGSDQKGSSPLLPKQRKREKT